MTYAWRPPESYRMHGTYIPDRVARVLYTRGGLGQYHHHNRGRDAEVDSVIAALRDAGLDWATSSTGTSNARLEEVKPLFTRVTTSEAAGLLGVTPRAIRQALEAGRIRGEKIGGQWFITREDFEHYKQTQESQRDLHR